MTTTKTNITATYKHQQLLQKVRTLVQHHDALTKAKGELFNIYNILNLRSNEVRTHSAFLAALLHPNGTHLLGTMFLEAFLALLPEEIQKHIDITTTTVFVEYFIGPISKKHKTGGRIDILLQDTNGHTICIENKIDAGDQDEQVERYYNYNTEKNKVVYLSKFGDEPSDKSKGNLEANEHFYIIGYQQEIISWLETCQALAYDQPIVRESIKQYKILIQKLTNTLGNQQNIALQEVVIANLAEAQQITSKFHQIVWRLKNDFRDQVFEAIKPKITTFGLEKRKNVSKNCSNIWFFNAQSNAIKSWFGVESFSGIGHLDGALFVGIYSDKGSLSLSEDYNQLNKGWVHHQVLRYDNKDINLSEIEFLQQLSNPITMQSVVESVSEQIIAFVKTNEGLLKTNS